MLDDAVPETGSTFRLMYRSRSLIPAANRKVELGELFTAARPNNKKRHVCGALLVTGDSFVQVLEGDESTVRKLYARIAHDARHESVTLVETNTIDEPVFARWAMAEVSAQKARRISRSSPIKTGSRPPPAEAPPRPRTWCWT